MSDSAYALLNALLLILEIVGVVGVIAGLIMLAIARSE